VNLLASPAPTVEYQPAPASTEWSILLIACSPLPTEQKIQRLRGLSQASINWKSLFDLSEKNGTQPLLHRALSLIGSVPREPMEILDRRVQTNLLKCMLVSRELIRIVDHCTALGLPVMPYKGPALAELLYGDVALRQSGDIDLLIRPQDFSGACEALRPLGYTPHLALSPRQMCAYLKSGYECAFDSSAGRNLLELQWAIQPRFYAVDFDIDQLFHRAMTVNVAGRSMKTLCLEDLFLVLSVHAAKHAWGKLIWLSDLAQLMTNPALKWDCISDQARRFGIVRILRVTLDLAHDLLEVTVPEAARKHLPEDLESSPLSKQFQCKLASQAEPDVESMSYFRVMLRLRERPSDRARFVQRLALTPGPSEWNAVQLPGILFPLYRVVRLGRLAARTVRSH
jgi:hypothetical protein